MFPGVKPPDPLRGRGGREGQYIPHQKILDPPLCTNVIALLERNLERNVITFYIQHEEIGRNLKAPRVKAT